MLSILVGARVSPKIEETRALNGTPAVRSSKLSVEGVNVGIEMETEFDPDMVNCPPEISHKRQRRVKYLKRTKPTCSAP